MDNIKVAIRVRPLIAKEHAAGLESGWVIKDDTIEPNVGPKGKAGTSYTFDRIFDQQMTTYDLFEEICRPIVDGAVHGFHGTIFAYGQSSSGKTFTMSGSALQHGIISLGVQEIFEQVDSSPDREFLIRIAYMEIYNEKVTDLLSSEEKCIRIQEDSEKNIQVTGVTEEMVTTLEDVYKIIKKGDANRHMAETKQNDRSSRSHCILRIIIESRLIHDEGAVKVAHMNFVDLAGSEKAGENAGERFREGCLINKSLFSLGHVISKLSDGVSHQHIGFRDSKLTRILQNALGGNSKTAIIATITPASLEESHGTLRFASRAKTIQNQAKVNEVLSDAALMKQYQKKIQQLQKKLDQLANADMQVEKEDLQKRLLEKEDMQLQQQAQIDKLKQYIIVSTLEEPGDLPQPSKKKRRETWCPGRMTAGRRNISFPKFPDFDDMQLPDIDEFPPFGATDQMDDKFTGKQSMESDRFSVLSMPLDPATKELMILQDKHEQLLTENKRLEQEYNDLHLFQSMEQQCLQDNLKRIEEENALLRNNTDLKQAQQERNEMSDELFQLQHKFKIQSSKLSDCQKELDILRATVTSTDSQDKESELRNQMEEMKSGYEKQVKELKTGCEKLMSEISNLKNINEEMRHRQYSSQQNYEGKIRDLEQEADLYQGKVTDFQEEMQKVEKDKQESASQISNLHATITKLKSQLEDRTVHPAASAASLSDEKDSFQTYVDDQSQMREEQFDKERQELKAKIEQLQSTAALELQEQASCHEEFDKERQELKAKIEQLQSTAALELQEQASCHEEFDKERQELKAKIEQLQSTTALELQEQASCHEEFDKERQELKAKIEQLQSTAALELQEQALCHEEFDKERQELKAKIEQLQSTTVLELQEQASGHEQFDKERQELKAKIEQLQSTTALELQEQASGHEQFDKERQELKAKIEQLQSTTALELQEQASCHEEFDKERQELKAKIEQLQSTAALELQEQALCHEEFDKERQELKAKIEQLQSTTVLELQEQASGHEQFDKERQELKAKIEQLQSTTALELQEQASVHEQKLSEGETEMQSMREEFQREKLQLQSHIDLMKEKIAEHRQSYRCISIDNESYDAKLNTDHIEEREALLNKISDLQASIEELQQMAESEHKKVLDREELINDHEKHVNTLMEAHNSEVQSMKSKFSADIESHKEQFYLEKTDLLCKIKELEERLAALTENESKMENVKDEIESENVDIFPGDKGGDDLDTCPEEAVKHPDSDADCNVKLLQEEIAELKERNEKLILEMESLVDPEALHTHFQNIVEVMKTEHTTTIQMLETEHQSVIEALKAEHKIALDALKIEHMSSLDVLKMEDENSSSSCCTHKVDIASLVEECDLLKERIQGLEEMNHELSKPRTDIEEDTVSQTVYQELLLECRVLREQNVNLQDSNHKLKTNNRISSVAIVTPLAEKQTENPILKLQEELEQKNEEDVVMEEALPSQENCNSGNDAVQIICKDCSRLRVECEDLRAEVESFVLLNQQLNNQLLDQNVMASDAAKDKDNTQTGGQAGDVDSDLGVIVTPQNKSPSCQQEDLRVRCEILEKEVHNLREKTGNIESLESEIKKLREEKECESCAECEMLREELKKSDEEKGQLVDDIISMDSNDERITELEQEINVLKDQLKSEEDDKLQILEKVSSLESYIVTLEEKSTPETNGERIQSLLEECELLKCEVSKEREEKQQLLSLVRVSKSGESGIVASDNSDCDPSVAQEHTLTIDLLPGDSIPGVQTTSEQYQDSSAASCEDISEAVWKEKVLVLEQKCSALTDCLASLEKESEDKLMELQNECELLRQEIAKHEQVEQSNSKCEKCQALQIEELQEELRRLQDNEHKCNEMVSEVERLKNVLEINQQESEQYRVKIVTMETEHSKLVQELSELEMVNEQLQERFEAEDERQQQKQIEVVSRLQESQEKQGELTKQLMTLETEKSKVETRLQEVEIIMKDNVPKLEVEKLETQEQVLKLETEKREILTQLQESQILMSDNISKLEVEKLEIQECLVKLEAEKHEITNSMEIQLQSLEREKTERICHLEARVKELEMDNDYLREENKEISGQQSSLNKTIKEIKMKSEMYEETVHDFQEEGEKHEMEKQQLREELKEVKETLSHYSSPDFVQCQIQTAVEGLTARYTQEIVTKDNELRKLHEDLEAAKTSSKNVQLQIDQINCQKTQELSAKEKDNQRLTDEIDKTKALFKTEMSELRRTYEAEITQLKKTHDNATQENKIIVEKLSQEIETLQSLRNNHVHSELDTKIRQQEEEIIQLKENLELEQKWRTILDSGTAEGEKPDFIKKFIEFERTEKIKRFNLTLELSTAKKAKEMALELVEDFRNEVQELRAVPIDKKSEIGRQLTKANEDADKYYELCNDLERKLLDAEKDLQRTTEESRAVKRKFAEVYNKFQNYKKNSEQDIGKKNLEINNLQHTLRRLEEDHQKRINDYKETIKMNEDQVRKLKGEIRRIGADEQTFVEPRKMALQFEDTKNAQISGAGGLIDHFNNVLLEGDNKRLKKMVNKLEAKLKDMEREKKDVSTYLRQIEELKMELEQEREENRKKKERLLDGHSSRNPLEAVNTSSQFKIPDLGMTKPAEHTKTLSEQKNECKPQ